MGKVPAIKPDNSSPIPRTHRAEGKDTCKLTSDFYMQTSYPHKINQILKTSMDGLYRDLTQ